MLSSVLIIIIIILLPNPRKRCSFAEYEILIRKVSCLMVRVRALFMSLLHKHQQRVDYIFLTIGLPQPPKIKRKKAKDVLGDKLPNRNNVVECTCYLPFATPQWGAADAEMKVPSGENTELKSPPCDVLISSFMTSSRVVYVIRCHDVSF